VSEHIDNMNKEKIQEHKDMLEVLTHELADTAHKCYLENSDEPMDGDGVDELVDMFKNKLNIISGNDTHGV